MCYTGEQEAKTGNRYVRSVSPRCDEVTAWFMNDSRVSHGSTQDLFRLVSSLLVLVTIVHPTYTLIQEFYQYPLFQLLHYEDPTPPHPLHPCHLSPDILDAPLDCSITPKDLWYGSLRLSNRDQTPGPYT